MHCHKREIIKCGAQRSIWLNISIECAHTFKNKTGQGSYLTYPFLGDFYLLKGDNKLVIKRCDSVYK